MVISVSTYVRKLDFEVDDVANLILDAAATAVLRAEHPDGLEHELLVRRQRAIVPSSEIHFSTLQQQPRLLNLSRVTRKRVT